MSEVVTLINEINASMVKMDNENKNVMAVLKESVESNGNQSKEAIARADKSAEEVSKLSASILELEQKLADKVKAGSAPVETLGRLIIQTEAYKQYAQGGRRDSGVINIQANTITGQSGSPLVNDDTLVEADRLPGIIPGAYRSLRVKDIIPVGRTNSNAITMPLEETFTNNAAATAEGAVKPESVITFTSKTWNVATIPTFLKASKQVLDDSAALETYLNNRLGYAVAQKYDYELINGDGTGTNISGMADTGNNTAFTPTSGENALDSVNRAIQSVYTADYIPTGIVMNPADWFSIERLKVQAGTDDRYIIGDPANAMMPRLWGLPVVITNNITSGKFFVADFQRAYGIFDRQGLTVQMFEQDEDNVQRNLFTIRAELRGTLATYVPAASRYGDLTSS